MSETELNLHSFHIVETVKWLRKLFKKKVIFCGSFSLAIGHKLNRSIGDIDCITEECYYGKDPGDYLPDDIIMKDFEYDIYKGNSHKFYVNGVQVLVFKLKSPYGIKVDVMYRPDETTFIKTIYHGVEIKVQEPWNAIEVKKYYLENFSEMDGCTGKSVEKHRSDITFYEKQS